ncbi:unnamed protein product [Closterium sp. Yama58-4]|nr:unnamed protein product [Closterium sp. Yama58-4]
MDEHYEDVEIKTGEEEESAMEAAEMKEMGDTANETAAVKQEVERSVNIETTTIMLEDEDVKGDGDGAAQEGLVVKDMKAFASAKEQESKEEARVEDHGIQEVIGVKKSRRSARLKKTVQGLDVKALNFKPRKQRFKVLELRGSTKSS